jgi:hypothetical protein
MCQVSVQAIPVWYALVNFNFNDRKCKAWITAGQVFMKVYDLLQGKVYLLHIFNRMLAN